jgi:hypothetical protein
MDCETAAADRTALFAHFLPTLQPLASTCSSYLLVANAKYTMTTAIIDSLTTIMCGEQRRDARAALQC